MSTPTIRRNICIFRLGLALALSLSLLIGLLLSLGLTRLTGVALAQEPTTRYVATTGGDSSNDCATSSAPCATIQHAVDVADPGDEIRVASGIYTATGSNVITIPKMVTIIGGFETSDWSTSVSSITTVIDGQKARRGIEVQGAITVTIANLVVTRGQANTGGGIYTRDFSSTLTVSESVITNNLSATDGGGLYIVGSAMLSGTRVFSNTAGQHGGGLYQASEGGWVDVTGGVFESNEAALSGGGLYILDSAMLSGTWVLSNTVGFLGGGLIKAGLEGQLDVIGGVFKGNEARHGGGLNIIGNAALSRVWVLNNMANQQGGGLRLDLSDATLANTIVADNQAGRGGGLSVERSSVQLLHTTITRNSSSVDGSGVYVTDASGTSSIVAITNTILASHTVGLTVATGNTATLNGVLWYSNTTNSGGDGNIAITHEYTGGPAFAADGYHLTAGSAAIDRGVNAGVSDDIDGDPRPLRCGFDIGADEYDAPCPPISVTIVGLNLGAAQINYAFTATASPVTVTLPLTYVWQATGQTPLINTGGLSDAVSFSWNTPGIKVITVTAANAGGTVVDTYTVNICHQGPINPLSSATHNLDHEAADWGVFCEGSPTWDKENVTTPSRDGEALQCAITGGEPHSNVHCYRNLLPEPTAAVFTMTTPFLFTPTTTCNNEGGPSVVQALEFAMNKWQDDKRYEFALQWQNVGEGAPQWRYWDPFQKWVPISPSITQCLEAGKWYTLTLTGEIIDDNVHYKNFTLDQESHPLDITVEPFPTPGEPDRLAVAVQLDGNETQSPYEVFLDQVSFIRAARLALEVTKHADPNSVQPGEQLTYTIRVTNTGEVDLHATITDTLPPQVTPNETLVWTPTITAPGGVWTQEVIVTVEACRVEPLTNVVQVTTAEGATGVYTAETLACMIYLPLISKDGS
jgi:uncharacterized repeat protein (TIGR01451 family)